MSTNQLKGKNAIIIPHCEKSQSSNSSTESAEPVLDSSDHYPLRCQGLALSADCRASWRCGDIPFTEPSELPE
jgi:hypothetical protein